MSVGDANLTDKLRSSIRLWGSSEANSEYPQALSEEVCEKQKEYLEIANIGGFWEKFTEELLNTTNRT